VIPNEAALLMSTMPELWGELWFEGEEETGTLTLFPDVPLQVRVVDGAGEPLGGMPILVGFGKAPPVDDPVITRAEDGLAVVAHAIAEARAQYASSIWIQLALPLGAPVRKKVDPLQPPADPVVLVAPTLGRLEVCVCDAEGAPLRDSVFVRVRPGKASPRDARTRSKVLRPGQTVFGLSAQVGIECEVLVRDTDFIFAAFPTILRRIPGPSRPGEVTRVEMRLEESIPILTGRVLDANGMPLAQWYSDVILCSARTQERTMIRPFCTGANGEFRYHLTPVARNQGGTLIVTPMMDPDEMRGLVIDLPNPLLPTEHDLGELRVGPLPLIVTGRVVDDLGTAIAGAMVGLQQDPNGREPWDLPEDLVLDWTYVPGAGGITGEDGRFDLRGLAPAGALAVDAYHNDYVDVDPVPVRTAATGIEIVLPRAGGIEARILVDEHLDELEIVATAQREFEGGYSWFIGHTHEQGRFLIDGLEPGEYDVTIGLGSAERPLFEVKCVVVRPGEITRDPRLDGLKVAGRILTVRVVDGAGDGLHNATARYRPTGDATGESHHADAGHPTGTLRLFVAKGAVDVNVRAKGHLTHHLVGLEEDTEVALRPAPFVRFRVANFAELPPSGYRLHVKLYPTWENPDRQDLGRRVNAQGEARIQVQEFGMYQVTYGVVIDGQQHMSLYDPDEDATVEVVDGINEQVIQIALPPRIRDFITSEVAKCGG